MKHMTILRGGPGSGKTTFAETVAQRKQAKVISADDYFTHDGCYDFRPSELGQAHGQCFRRAVASISNWGCDLVVDNTNSQSDEMIPYLALAQAYGYTVEIITMVCDPEVAWARQTHGLPREKFDQINRRLLANDRTPALYRGAPWIRESVEVTDNSDFNPQDWEMSS